MTVLRRGAINGLAEPPGGRPSPLRSSGSFHFFPAPAQRDLRSQGRRLEHKSGQARVDERRGRSEVKTHVNSVRPPELISGRPPEIDDSAPTTTPIGSRDRTTHSSTESSRTHS